LLSRENSEVFDLVATGVAAICAVVTDKRAVAQEEEVRVRIEKRAARIASKAFDMPSLPSCEIVSTVPHGDDAC